MLKVTQGVADLYLVGRTIQRVRVEYMEGERSPSHAVTEIWFTDGSHVRLDVDEQECEYAVVLNRFKPSGPRRIEGVSGRLLRDLRWCAENGDLTLSSRDAKTLLATRRIEGVSGRLLRDLRWCAENGDLTLSSRDARTLLATLGVVR